MSLKRGFVVSELIVGDRRCLGGEHRRVQRWLAPAVRRAPWARIGLPPVELDVRSEPAGDGRDGFLRDPDEIAVVVERDVEHLAAGTSEDLELGSCVPVPARDAGGQNRDVQREPRVSLERRLHVRRHRSRRLRLTPDRFAIVGPAGQVRGRDDDNIGVRVEDDEPILGKPVAESREAQQAAVDVMSQVGVCGGVVLDINGSVPGERACTLGVVQRIR
jgi:hypothetical protein